MNNVNLFCIFVLYLKTEIMTIIGFGGTFYTLWTVTTERVYIDKARWYDKVIHTYHKNLSKDLNEAIAKAGTDKYSENLKGKKRSFEVKQPIQVEPELMTECKELFRIIFVNDKENLVDGVRERAFKQALELGYISEVDCDFTKYNEDTDTKMVFKKAYQWNDKLRDKGEWYSKTLGVAFKGII